MNLQSAVKYLVMTFLFAGVFVSLFPRPALAHVLGNNTVNRQAWLHATPTALELRYLMDVAEIPTLAQGQNADSNRDGDTSDEEWDAYTRQWAAELPSKLQLEINGQPVALKLDSQSHSLTLGDVALNTLRLEARLSTPLSGQGKSASLRYKDQNSPGQFGWKEIWMDAEDGITIDGAGIAKTDRSNSLTRYTLPAGTEPPNETRVEATINFATPAQASATASPATDIKPDSNDEAPTSAAPGTASSNPAGQSSWFTQQSWPFFKLGMYHIATGWDHLLFLFGLLLFRQSLPTLIKVVTAFTIAHSVTLALAANGWVTPPGSWIEPAIALTIAYVGLANLLWRQIRHGIWLAFGFGLIHGFGFAGALEETLAGHSIANNSWLISLLSFNLGIEAFQVLLVCLLVPLLRYARRFSWYELTQAVASCAIVVAGLGWFVTRTIEYL